MSKLRQRVAVRGVALGFSDGFVLDAHAHDWSQLLYASRGVMLVQTIAGSWVVPPQRAVWLPPHVDHEIEMRGEVAMRTLYFRDPRPHLDVTQVIGISPLLRELVLHCVGLMKLDLAIPHEARLAGLLGDLLDAVRPMPLELPMPRDPRAVRAAQRIRRDPGGPLGATRTIERLFLAETGLTLGRWRQQARLLHALAALAGGSSVSEAAERVGYASPSAFIAMFKALLGTSPRKYLE
jgi:Helix-turn-helix domain/AraC-like ligand binding domain